MKSRGKGNAGKLSQHFASSGHKADLNAFLAFQNKSSHLDLLLDKERRKVLIEEEAESQRNREAINTLLDITRTLARQGISFRGSSSEKDGNGNFRQISSLVARHSPSFKRWLDDASKRPHRVDYLSSRSQNEFLDLLAEDVTRRVTAEINQAGMFSVIADTTPDVSHVDQLSVVARYVNAEGNPQERLVDIKVIDDKTGDGHAQGIISSLNEKCLDTADVVFQSYDYTSSMSGIYKGCQAKLKEYLGREVPYFPCLAHRVNTTVEHSNVICLTSSRNCLSFLRRARRDTICRPVCGNIQSCKYTFNAIHKYYLIQSRISFTMQCKHKFMIQSNPKNIYSIQSTKYLFNPIHKIFIQSNPQNIYSIFLGRARPGFDVDN